jgi:outer membrane protein insertion porin family
VAALLSSCVYAAEYDTATISSVSGAPSDIPLETKAGQILDPVKLRDDVKLLWRSGRFSDVRAESVGDSSGVRVVFKVKPKASLRLRRYEVTPPTPGIDLKLTPGAEIDTLGAHQIASGVRAKMEELGYPSAKVEADLVPAGPGRADLEVRIDQGQNIRVQEAAVTGELGVNEAAARKALKWTGSKTMLPGIPGIWGGWRIRPGYSENAVQYDAANLRSFYYTHGFFDAEVATDPVDIRAGGKARVQFTVRSGPRYAIRQFNLVGAEETRLIQTGADGAFPAREACNALLAERRKAERAGVIDFSARIEVRELEDGPTAAADGRKWADLTATVDRGPVYRIGRIEFRGNRRVADTTVRRAFLMDEGELLDQMLLRKSMARLNETGFFEPLTENSVVVNTPPGTHRADITVRLEEKKLRHWSFSGPVGPMSIGGPLNLAIGSRLPSWGRGLLELSTYTASMNLMFFAKPLSQILPGLPNRRLLAIATIQRPLLPGQRFVSGFTIAPQLGWQGLLASYGISQTRSLLSPLLESDRTYTPALSVTIARPGPGGPADRREGVMYCEAPKTTLDWAKQIGGTATRFAFAFVPF